MTIVLELEEIECITKDRIKELKQIGKESYICNKRLYIETNQFAINDKCLVLSGKGKLYFIPNIRIDDIKIYELNK